MKTITRSRANTLAHLPAAIESAPRSGPTVRSSMMLSGAGSAPARSKIASSFADSTVKLPEMMPLPPRIGSWMRGELITLASSTIAKSSPT